MPGPVELNALLRTLEQSEWGFQITARKFVGRTYYRVTLWMGETDPPRRVAAGYYKTLETALREAAIAAGILPEPPGRI